VGKIGVSFVSRDPGDSHGREGGGYLTGGGLGGEEGDGMCIAVFLVWGLSGVSVGGTVGVWMDLSGISGVCFGRALVWCCHHIET